MADNTGENPGTWTSPYFTSPRGLPRRVSWGGFVYVIEFENGRIKVGLTTHPRLRVSQHCAYGKAYGNPLVKGWLSPWHEGAIESEQALLAIARKLGGAAQGEFFTGVSFDDVVSRARRRRYVPVDVVAHKAEDARRYEEAKAYGFTFVTPEQRASEPIDEVIRGHIGEWFGRSGDNYEIGPMENLAMPWSLAERLAVRGRTIEDVLDMDCLDLTEAFLHAIVEREAAEARLHLRNEGRTDWFVKIGSVLVDDELA